MSDYAISEPSPDPESPAAPAPRKGDDQSGLRDILVQILEQGAPPRPRTWRSLLGLLCGWGDRTTWELALERRIVGLRDSVDESDRLYREAVAELNAVRAENEFARRRWQAEILAAKREVELLSEIHERDTLRVRAEQAEYAQRIASTQKAHE